MLFATVQAVSALILYTGANTSFDGFPFWASFAAVDSFLPRQLTKCGHRSSELSLAATGVHRQSQHILVALQGDPEGRVHRSVGPLALAHLHHEGIDEDRHIHRIQPTADHSSISATTLSVIRDTVSFDTDAP